MSRHGATDPATRHNWAAPGCVEAGRLSTRVVVGNVCPVCEAPTEASS